MNSTSFEKLALFCINGGDGGESNSPSRGSGPGSTTGLADSLSYLANLCQPSLARPVDSFLGNPHRLQDHRTSTLRRPFPTYRGEVGVDGAAFIRLLLIQAFRRLFFCHQFYEGSGTSTCTPVTPSPVEPTHPHLQRLSLVTAHF